MGCVSLCAADELDAIGTKRFDSEIAGDREVQRTMLELLNQLDGFSSDDRIKVSCSQAWTFREPCFANSFCKRILRRGEGVSSQVIAATNRPDVLDPALLRSGRLDRKIELPHPNEDARERILQIHARKMNVNKQGGAADGRSRSSRRPQGGQPGLQNSAWRRRRKSVCCCVLRLAADVCFRELARSTDDFNGAQLKAVCVEAGMCALRRQASELKHEDFVAGIAAVQAKKKSALNYFT